MTRATAITTFIGGLKAMEGVKENGKDNFGEMIALFLKYVGLPQGYPWCAAMQVYVGHKALTDSITKLSVWPVPATGSCQEIGNWAKGKGILFDTPEVGDLMLFWLWVNGEKRWRFAHVEGVLDVTDAAKGVVHTIGGNTNDDGSANGWGALFKDRPFGGDYQHKFVRWANLLPE